MMPAAQPNSATPAATKGVGTKSCGRATYRNSSTQGAGGGGEGSGRDDETASKGGREVNVDRVQSPPELPIPSFTTLTLNLGLTDHQGG